LDRRRRGPREREASIGPRSRDRGIASLLPLSCILSPNHKRVHHGGAGSDVALPKRKDKLAEGVLNEQDVFRMIHPARKPRNRALLRLLHAGARGSRRSAGCSGAMSSPRRGNLRDLEKAFDRVVDLHARGAA
jgi:hypothetical protein